MTSYNNAVMRNKGGSAPAGRSINLIDALMGPGRWPRSRSFEPRRSLRILVDNGRYKQDKNVKRIPDKQSTIGGFHLYSILVYYSFFLSCRKCIVETHFSLGASSIVIDYRGMTDLE